MSMSFMRLITITLGRLSILHPDVLMTLILASYNQAFMNNPCLPNKHIMRALTVRLKCGLGIE